MSLITKDLSLEVIVFLLILVLLPMVFIEEPVFLLRVSRLTEDFFDILRFESIDGVEDTFEFVDCSDEDEDKLLDEQLSLSLDWDAEKPYWNLVFNSTWETFEA